MKAAYTNLALRYHPDRQSDTSTEHAELTAWRLRELNEAWAVLRNPAARARYDATLAAATSGTVLTSEGRAWRFDEPEVAEVERIDDAARPTQDRRGRMRGRLRGGPLVAVGIAIVLVLLAAGRYVTSGPAAVNVVTRERFAVGNCVLVTPSERASNTAVDVSCSAPHTGRIQAKTEFPQPCPQGTFNVVILEEQLSLCLSP